MMSGTCTIYLWWRLQLRTVAVACSLGAVMSESRGVVTGVGDRVRREWLGLVQRSRADRTCGCRLFECDLHCWQQEWLVD